MTTSGTQGRTRALSGAVDQVFSSISNGFIVYAVAVVASPESFGHITLLMTSLMAVLSCFRGGFGIPLLLKADQAFDDVRREGSFALTVVIVIGPVVSIAILMIAPRMDFATIALAVAAPIVLAQDMLRYVAMAASRPHVAAVWDGVWCVGTLLVLICSWIGLPFIDAGLVLALWGLLALIAFVAMAIDLGLLPSIRGLYARYRPDLHHRLRYAADAGLEQIGLLIVFAVTSVMVSPDATGALRGAIALLAPLLIAASAVQLVMIPESVRSSSPPLKVWRTLGRVMGVLAFIAVLAGVAYTFLPQRVGSLLLGESFASAQRVVPYMTAQFIAAAVTFAILVYLRTFNRSGDVLRLKLIYLAAIITSAVVGARMTGSAAGVSIGLAVASAVVALIAFASVSPRRHQRENRATQNEGSEDFVPFAGGLPDEVAQSVADVPSCRAVLSSAVASDPESLEKSTDTTEKPTGTTASVARGEGSPPARGEGSSPVSLLSVGREHRHLVVASMAASLVICWVLARAARRRLA